MILSAISTPTLSCQHTAVGTVLEISFNLNVAGRNKQVGFYGPSTRQESVYTGVREANHSKFAEIRVLEHHWTLQSFHITAPVRDVSICGMMLF